MRRECLLEQPLPKFLFKVHIYGISMFKSQCNQYQSDLSYFGTRIRRKATRAQSTINDIRDVI